MSRNWTTSDLADVYRRRGLDVPEAVKQACSDGTRPHKFGARKTTVDGITFDSAREAHHYQALKIAESAGAIQNLELQPEFLLQAGYRDENGKWHRKITYRADFKFTRNGDTIYVDVKGFMTPAFRLKEKLFRKKYPDVTLEIWP